MDTKQKLRLGLQWGALAWLVYITVQSALLGSCPMVFVWMVVCGLLAAGSRWARAAVAVAILAQLTHGAFEAVKYLTPGDISQFPMLFIVKAALRHSGIALCLGMLPLIAWPIERPRVVLALLGLGRVRDAWARSGGGLALLCAVPVIALNHATMSFLRESKIGLLGLAAVALSLLFVRYGEVMVAWPLNGRQPR
jgi:hypothetical protein